MKAMSLWQPWAQLVVLRMKRFETRTWSTNYRGALLIHAGQRVVGPAEVGAAGAEDLEHLYRRLEEHGFDRHQFLPRGELIGVCILASVWPTEIVAPWLRNGEELEELRAGDFSDGRFAWSLEGAAPFARPICYSGRQGLFDVPSATLEVARILEPPPPTSGAGSQETQGKDPS